MLKYPKSVCLHLFVCKASVTRCSIFDCIRVVFLLERWSMRWAPHLLQASTSHQTSARPLSRWWGTAWRLILFLLIHDVLHLFVCKASMTPCSIFSVLGRYSHSCCKGEAGDEPPTCFTLPPVTKEAQGTTQVDSYRWKIKFFHLNHDVISILLSIKPLVTPCFHILCIRVVLTLLLQQWGWRQATTSHPSSARPLPSWAGTAWRWRFLFFSHPSICCV
jgi:hypothetical protein